MKRLTLLFAGSFLLFASLACSGGESERISSDPPATVSEQISNDPRTILDQAQAAMADLESYHAAFVFPPDPDSDDAQETRLEISFAAPDSFRFLVFLPGGEITCEASIAPDGLSRDQICFEGPTSATETTLSEMVVTGDTIYRRQCEDIDIECEPWEEQPREQVVFPGSPASHPQWPIVAMEMAADLEFVGQEEIDGVALAHYRGSVNQIRAVMETLRRSAIAAGITSFGTTCTSVALTPTMIDETGKVVESVPGTPVENEERCRERTFEESLASQEPGLSFADDNPATFDIWVSPDDFLVQRVAINISPDQPGGVDFAFVVEYSLFDQVQIEAPR